MGPTNPKLDLLRVAKLGNAQRYGNLGSACLTVGVGGALMKRVTSSSMRYNRANAPVKRALLSLPSAADPMHDNIGVRLTMCHC
jgi:hypothetical protein